MTGLRAERARSDGARGVLAADGRQAGGNWCPFGRGADQAGDQREDDARSLVFETPPLDEPIEILGAAIVTLEVASDRPIANLVVRLCDVHPSGESLRVSYGVLNLTHRDGHETPRRWRRGALPGAHPAQRRRLGVSGRPQDQARALHRLLADDLARPENGDADDLGRHARSAGAPAPGRGRVLPPLPGPETATPERPTVIRPRPSRAHRPPRP